MNRQRAWNTAQKLPDDEREKLIVWAAPEGLSGHRQQTRFARHIPGKGWALRKSITIPISAVLWWMDVPPIPRQEA